MSNSIFSGPQPLLSNLDSEGIKDFIESQRSSSSQTLSTTADSEDEQSFPIESKDELTHPFLKQLSLAGQIFFKSICALIKENDEILSPRSLEVYKATLYEKDKQSLWMEMSFLLPHLRGSVPLDTTSIHPEIELFLEHLKGKDEPFLSFQKEIKNSISSSQHTFTDDVKKRILSFAKIKDQLIRLRNTKSLWVNLSNESEFILGRVTKVSNCFKLTFINPFPENQKDFHRLSSKKKAYRLMIETEPMDLVTSLGIIGYLVSNKTSFYTEELKSVLSSRNVNRYLPEQFGYSGKSLAIWMMVRQALPKKECRDLKSEMLLSFLNRTYSLIKKGMDTRVTAHIICLELIQKIQKIARKAGCTIDELNQLHTTLVGRLHSYECPIKFSGKLEKTTPFILQKVTLTRSKVPSLGIYSAFTPTSLTIYFDESDGLLKSPWLENNAYLVYYYLSTGQPIQLAYYIIQCIEIIKSIKKNPVKDRKYYFNNTLMVENVSGLLSSLINQLKVLDLTHSGQAKQYFLTLLAVYMLKKINGNEENYSDLFMNLAHFEEKFNITRIMNSDNFWVNSMMKILKLI